MIFLSENIVREKSFKFALDIINLYKHLTVIQKEFILSKQILRSGTSIGANVRESLRGQSRRDFLSKMNIALKEAEETEYWFELLIESDYLDTKHYYFLYNNCKELCRILHSIVKTTDIN